MKKLTSDPLATTPSGTCEDRRRMISKRTLRDVLGIGSVFTVLFVVADWISAYIKWTAVQRTNWIFVLVLAFVCAAILDVPMYFAGRTYREYQSGLKDRKTMLPIVILAGAAFLVVYIPFIFFSFTTKSATFEEALPLGSDLFGFDPAASAPSNPQSVTAAAVLSLLLPFGTSIASFVVGLAMYRPLEDLIEKVERSRSLALAHRSKVKEGLVQEASRTKRLELYTKNLKDMQQIFNEEVDCQTQIRIQAAYTALMKKLDAEGILHVSERANEQLDAANFSPHFDPLTADAICDPGVYAGPGTAADPVSAAATTADPATAVSTTPAAAPAVTPASAVDTVSVTATAPAFTTAPAADETYDEPTEDETYDEPDPDEPSVQADDETIHPTILTLPTDPNNDVA